MNYNPYGLKLFLSPELIAKSIDKKHPQVLLRRTESVVEKLLPCWMSLCLYDSIISMTGKPLFMLVKALKHQVEKGE